LRSIKIKNLIIFTNLFLFIIFGLFFYFFTEGKTYLFTSDFSFYHSFANNILGNIVSDFSEKLNEFSDTRLNWNPSFFYSIIFLLPITIFGSKELFFFEGLVIGSIIISNLYFAIYKLNDDFSEKQVFLILLFTILFPSFLIETITVSTNSVFFLFGILAFNANKNISRVFYLIFCSLIRPNFIVILFSIIFSTLIYKPKGYKSFLLTCIPSVSSYIIAYKLSYIGYPGSGINYLIMADGQHISAFKNYSDILFSELIEDKQNGEIVFWKLNPYKFFKLITSNNEIFTYFFNLVVTKISLTLGYLHDGLTYSKSGLWFIKIWRTIYFILISLPSFYLSFIGIFLNRFSNLEKTTLLSGLIMVIFNSSFLGMPKYFVGIHFILVYGFFKVLKEINLLNLSIKNN